MLSKGDRPVILEEQEKKDHREAEQDKKRREREQKIRESKREKQNNKRWSKGLPSLEQETQQSRVDWYEKTPEAGKTPMAAEELENDVPSYMRKYTDRYPFGNVHVALQFGPVVIENGVRP